MFDILLIESDVTGLVKGKEYLQTQFMTIEAKILYWD